VVENAAVPEGLFIEEEKLVKFTLMSKVLRFLFGFWKEDKKTLFKLNDVEATVIIFKGWKSPQL